MADEVLIIMMYISRVLDVFSVVKSKSCFLFGPRQTGKSTLIKNMFAGIKRYNLLDDSVYRKLSFRPETIREELDAKDKLVIIDEIQKLPALLDFVHLMIEDYGVRFLMTGSNTRKLRNSGVNLLGGRARQRTLHPFSYFELKEHFDLLHALNFGLIPSIYFSDDPAEDLDSYIGHYLREEIADEAASKNIPAFSRFLEVAALSNGHIINYSNVSNDAQVPLSTVREYFEILKLTLLGYELPAWGETKKRKPIQTSKFFLFDVGITRMLQNRTKLKERSPEFGDAFEHFIFHELKTFVDTKKGELNFWRSTSGFEVDFILNGETAIEVKGKETIGGDDLKGLRALQEEKACKNYIIVCNEKKPRKVDGVKILPWRLFLDELWGKI